MIYLLLIPVAIVWGLYAFGFLMLCGVAIFRKEESN